MNTMQASFQTNCDKVIVQDPTRLSDMASEEKWPVSLAVSFMLSTSLACWVAIIALFQLFF